MSEEPALAAERTRMEALRRVLQQQLPREAPSPALRRRIEASIGLRAAASRPSWRAMAASIALAAVISSASTWALLHPGRDGLADAVVANHMRALMAPQSTDVPSSDRHTVKPWFNGRIPQAPRVVDSTAEGFPLVGGRLDVIDRTPVPTLVYRRRQHVISLTAVPETARAGVSAPSAMDGYNLLAWNDKGVAYWATSDLNAPELAKFAAAFRAAP